MGNKTKLLKECYDKLSSINPPSCRIDKETLNLLIKIEKSLESKFKKDDIVRVIGSQHISTITK